MLYWFKITGAGKSWGSWSMIAIYRVAKPLYENQAVRSVSVWPRRAASIEDITANASIASFFSLC